MTWEVQMISRGTVSKLWVSDIHRIITRYMDYYRVFEEYFPIGLNNDSEKTTYTIAFFKSATLKLTSCGLFEGIKSKEIDV